MHTHPRRDRTKQARAVKPEPADEAAAQDAEALHVGPALDDLRASISRVEALADAANNAVDGLPFFEDRTSNRRIGRVFRLVEETATAASRALDKAEAVINRLAP